MSTPRKFSLAIMAALVLFLLVRDLCAQSLGDIARQQREKNKQQATTTNKVLTNDDLSTPGHSADAISGDSQKKPAKQKSSATAGQSDKDEPPSAEGLKAAIQDKKESIAETQDEIAKLQSTINYVQNNRNIYTNAPEYNNRQKRKEQEVSRLKGVLQQQQDELKDLQDTARKAGYGSAVYD